MKLLFSLYKPQIHKTSKCLPIPAFVSSSFQLWHAKSGSLIQKLPADQPVLDICPMKVNQTNLLATLTEKKVKIYRWE